LRKKNRPKAIIKGIRSMHSTEAFEKGSQTMHSSELSKKAFGSTLGIQCRFGQSVPH